MQVIRVTFVSLARQLGLGSPRGGGVDGFLRLFAVEALGAILAVRRRARVLLIERVLLAGGAANSVNVAGVNFKAYFAGFFAGFFAGTIILENALRQGKQQGDVGFNLLTNGRELYR